MSFVDALARAQAAKAIGSYGKTATLNKIAAGTYDPATSAVINTTTPYVVKVLIETYSQGLIDGTLILAGDLKLTMPALNNQVPVAGDEIVFDGITRKIVAVNSVFSGEQVATFIMQARI